MKRVSKLRVVFIMFIIIVMVILLSGCDESIKSGFKQEDINKISKESMYKEFNVNWDVYFLVTYEKVYFNNTIPIDIDSIENLKITLKGEKEFQVADSVVGYLIFGPIGLLAGGGGTGDPKMVVMSYEIEGQQLNYTCEYDKYYFERLNGFVNYVNSIKINSNRR